MGVPSAFNVSFAVSIALNTFSLLVTANFNSSIVAATFLNASATPFGNTVNIALNVFFCLLYSF